MPFLQRPDGVRLYHEIHGEPAAPPLVLLEGMGGDIPGWRHNVSRLARTLRVIAYDFRGNGNSDEPPGPCTMATFVEDTVALMDELAIDRVHAYGQSFGGMVAQELVLTHPERVATAILAATHCGPASAIPVADRAVPKGESWRAMYSPSFPDEHPEHVVEDLRVGAAQPRHPVGGRRQWEAMQGWSACERLGGIGLPVLVVHGTEDGVVAPANAEVLASGIQGAELAWIEGAGHLYHSERGEEADEVVVGFVRRHV